MKKRRVGILGYGKLGQHLSQALMREGSPHELAFVWNRTPDAIGAEIPITKRLHTIGDFAKYEPDLVVEVAHPAITKKWGPVLLANCDCLLYTSPSPRD